MNYNWERKAERGQYETGFVDIYELVDEKKAIVIIYYLSQHEHTKQRVILTVILEGKKENWTKGDIRNIFEDIEYTITKIDHTKLNSIHTLEYLDTQIFTVKSIEDFDYLSHGDYNFCK